jgi:hypothetical protein
VGDGQRHGAWIRPEGSPRPLGLSGGPCAVWGTVPIGGVALSAGSQWWVSYEDVRQCSALGVFSRAGSDMSDNGLVADSMGHQFLQSSFSFLQH